MNINNMLATIRAKKLEEIEQAKKKFPLEKLRSELFPKTRDFISPLRRLKPAVIAEIKKGSPSKGVICTNFDVAQIARDYDAHGAACISVLTDESFFYGNDSHIQIAKKNCKCPVLRKEFIIDPYQVYQSCFLGADCILLIAAMLSDHQLHELCNLALSLTMSVLIEVHNKYELERVVPLPTPLIGINNRDLNNFNTDIKTSIRLKKLIPKDKIIISESGIHKRSDIEQLTHEGIYCFLIGESLMRKKMPGKYLKELIT